MNPYLYMVLIAFFASFSYGVRLFVSSGVGEYLRETEDPSGGGGE